MAQIDISKYNHTKKAAPKNSRGSSLLAFLNQDIKLGKNGLSDKKKEMFYAELSTLIKSGIDIKTALDLICISFDKPADKNLFEDIKKKVIAGQALSLALKEKGVFSAYEYYSVKIGEETGKSAQVLHELYLYFKRKINQRRKIIGAITYPIVILSTSFAAIFFMIKFVVPMFADVFTRFGGKLPYLTQVIINISDSLDKYFYVLLLLPFALFVFYQSQKQTLYLRKILSALILRLPIVGDIVRKIYLARIANTLRLLVGTSIPLLQAISMVRQMIGFYPVAASLLEAENDLMHGKSLSMSLEKHDFYPVKFVQMIKIAEEVNRLEYFFEQLAEQYTEEVEFKTNTIASLMEPLIIIILGMVVGTILIAMYLPMFQMSNSF